MPKLTLRIDGMDCAEEVATLRLALEPLEGVEDLAFDLLGRRLTVTHDPRRASSDTILRAIQETGLRARPVGEGDHDAHSDQDLRRRRLRTAGTALAGALWAAGFAIDVAIRGWRDALGGAGVAPWAVRVAYLATVAIAMAHVLPKALSALRRVRLDMNVLMVAAVAGAIAIGETFEAATVAFLFAVSLALETWTLGRARRAIQRLLQIAPDRATVIDAGGNETEVDAADVAVGSRFVVKPGQRIPLDGRVARGRTSVDQSPITGESMPAEKVVGAEVFAGSVNLEGAIEVTATKPAQDSLAARIARMVSEASARRSRSEQWVERFSTRYTPLVFLVASALALGGLLTADPGAWLYRALVLLVVACPCALVISTPVAMVASIAAASRRGVLVRGGEAMEMPARLRGIALDKTGTLTEGRPTVVQVVALEGHTDEDVLRIAAAIEQRSEHPLARAIVQHAAAKAIRPDPVEEYVAVPGKGARALLDGKGVWIGSHRYFEDLGLEEPEAHATLEALAVDGRSVVVVGEERHACGFVALADGIRTTAKDTVAELRADGLAVAMLTGDNWPTARAVAAVVGIDLVHAELLPHEKVEVVERLLTAVGPTALVGDGINDAPALARASLGIAMGAAGSDLAVETADITLVTSDLTAIPWLVRHSRRTLRVIRQDVAAALVGKSVFLLLAVVGHASLWAAIAADMGITLLVVVNALRLLRSTDDARMGGHAGRATGPAR